jgi:hypothetical protein
MTCRLPEPQLEISPKVSQRKSSANLEAPAAEAHQEVADLIECLDGGGRIVDGQRQRSDRNVHEEADRVFRILIKGALHAERDALRQITFVNRDARAEHTHDRHRFLDRVPDDHGDFDDRTSRRWPAEARTS